MTVNPYTLQDETEEQRRERQKLTGETGNGMVVKCHPTEDPEVVQDQHRVACLMRPYPNCNFCRHGNFTLVFLKKNRTQVDTVARQQVRCPRWETPRGHVTGNAPDYYVSVERATCDLQPYDFCKDGCPAASELVQMGIDKTKDEWYSRWRRFTRDEEEDEEEDG